MLEEPTKCSLQDKIIFSKSDWLLSQNREKKFFRFRYVKYIAFTLYSVNFLGKLLIINNSAITQ